MTKSTGIPGHLQRPPRWATRLLHWFCAPHLVEEMEGDLKELFEQRAHTLGVSKARRRYVRDVLSLMQPFAIKRKPTIHREYSNPALTDMLRNYLKIALRNLANNKVYSFINITGLAMGMSVAILIGLWVYDELSVNKTHQNYGRIAQVMQNQTFESGIQTWTGQAMQLAPELRSTYGSHFKYVVTAGSTGNHLLTAGETKITKKGNYMEPEITEMLSLISPKCYP